MKKIITTTTIVLLFLTNSLKAQITLDTTITTWNSIGYDFYTVQISKTETKYYIQDTITNTFSLYNMDFSPFMLNIPVPEPFLPFQYNFEVTYITRTLFDCDSSNIEFAYKAVGSGQTGAYKPFYIMRTDGTQLFKLDSALAPYCFGCLNGSQDIRPIQNTSAGAKLFLYYPVPTNRLRIYSLCGTLPQDVFDFTNQNKYSIKIYPNPTSGSLSFQINLPDNINDYELIILDNNGKEMKREKINFGVSRYDIEVSSFSSGSYIYSLQTKNKAWKSGKFILNK